MPGWSTRLRSRLRWEGGGGSASREREEGCWPAVKYGSPNGVLAGPDRYGPSLPIRPGHQDSPCPWQSGDTGLRNGNQSVNQTMTENSEPNVMKEGLSQGRTRGLVVFELEQEKELLF